MITIIAILSGIAVVFQFIAHILHAPQRAEGLDVITWAIFTLAMWTIFTPVAVLTMLVFTVVGIHSIILNHL